jgi:hypothetical protein
LASLVIARALEMDAFAISFEPAKNAGPDADTSALGKDQQKQEEL